MLSLDCIREIAYWCNYKTTKILLDLHPKLNNTDFWKTKCSKNFPNQNYLDFYTGEENYLLCKGDDFVLLISLDKYNYECEDILFEYNEMLNDILKIINKKIFDKIDHHHLIHINIQCQLVVLCLVDSINIIGQCTTREEAIKIIKSDYQSIYDPYMIIDMASITPHFVKYGKLTKSGGADYELFCPEELEL